MAISAEQSSTVVDDAPPPRSRAAALRVPWDAARSRPPFSLRSVRFAAGVGAVAAGYYAVAWVGLEILLGNPNGAFWPATGFAIAVLYLGGMRWWPGILLGSLLAREWESLPFGTALAWTAADVVTPLLAVIVLRRLVGGRIAMDRLEHVRAVVIASAVGGTFSATVAVLAAKAGGIIGASEMWLFWRNWVLGDVSGDLVVVPLALAWAHPLVRAWRGRGTWEGALMVAVVVTLSVIALSAEQPLTYLVFPAFTWAALRFGPQGATLAVAVAVAVVAVVWVMGSAVGPFVAYSPSESALHLQLYIPFAAITSLCLSAFVAERRRDTAELADAHSRIASAGERERRRMEAELHDSAQNRLVALKIRMSLAQERAEETAPELAGTLSALIDDAGAIGDDLSRIARGIVPPLLAINGLPEALRAEASHSAIPVSIAANDIGHSDRGIELAVYLSCLESIQNAAKHAGRDATVTVRLHREQETLQFSVHDTGRGFDPRTAKSGAGLTNLHDRVDAFGGHVDIVAAPGRGTTVIGVVPWPSGPR